MHSNETKAASLAIAHALIHKDGEELVRQQAVLAAIEHGTRWFDDSLRSVIHALQDICQQGIDYVAEIEAQEEPNPFDNEPDYENDEPYEPIPLWDEREDFHSDG